MPSEEWAETGAARAERILHPPATAPAFCQRSGGAPDYAAENDEIVSMPGRARICPYYFVANDRVSLGGVLATLVPSDKKLIHGMRDAIISPGRSRSFPSPASSSASRPWGMTLCSGKWPMGAPETQGTPSRTASRRRHSLGAAPFRLVFVMETAEDQPADPLQHARQPELGEHPVDAVGLLADVFQEEDRAPRNRAHREFRSDEPDRSCYRRATGPRRGPARRSSAHSRAETNRRRAVRAASAAG